MKTLLFSALCVTLLAASATAQITEVPAMTTTNNIVDSNNLGVGGDVFTVADFNAAGSPNNAGIVNMDLVASTAAAGIYSTNTGHGNSIAAISGYQLGLVDLVFSSFDAFNSKIDLGGPSTEIGFGISDWVGPIISDMYLGGEFGTLVGMVTSTTYSTFTPKYFQSTAPFDYVFSQASTTSGNWCFTEFAIEETVPAGPTLTITGTCPGPGSIDCSGMTAGGLVYIGYTPAGAGSWVIPSGGCAGATVNVAAQPTLLFAVAADAGGNVSIPGSMPATACGVITTVAFDVSTCTSTNAVAL